LTRGTNDRTPYRNDVLYKSTSTLLSLTRIPDPVRPGWGGLFPAEHFRRGRLSQRTNRVAWQVDEHVKQNRGISTSIHLFQVSYLNRCPLKPGLWSGPSASGGVCIGRVMARYAALVEWRAGQHPANYARQISVAVVVTSGSASAYCKHPADSRLALQPVQATTPR